MDGFAGAAAWEQQCAGGIGCGGLVRSGGDMGEEHVGERPNDRHSLTAEAQAHFAEVEFDVGYDRKPSTARYQATSRCTTSLVSRRWLPC